MIGDEEFDVIVMEYFTVATCNAGMLESAKRLREIFPDAIIVIARFWDTPMLVNKYQEDLRTYSFTMRNSRRHSCILSMLINGNGCFKPNTKISLRHTRKLGEKLVPILFPWQSRTMLLERMVTWRLGTRCLAPIPFTHLNWDTRILQTEERL
jgi:hypothetical protein